MAARNGVGVRLFTEGGKEVDASFNRMGESGDRAFSKLVRGVQKTNPEMRALSRTMDAVNDEMKGMAGRLGPIGDGLVALGPKAMIAGAAIAAIGIGAAKGFGAAVDAAGDFEGAMNDIGSKAGIRGDDLTKMGDQIQRIAVKWGELPGTVAVAAKDLVAAGVKIDDVMNGALESVIALAQGTEADLATSSGVAADAMLIWGKRGSEMKGVANEIAAVLNATKYELLDYAQAQGQGAATAKTAGMEFTDFNATLAATAPNFSGGSDQATSLKTAMMMLANATPAARAEMEDFGIKVFDAAGKIKSMTQFADELREITKDMSDEQRLSVLGKIFGSDAVKMAAALADNADKLREFREAILPAANVAAQAEQRFDGMRGATANLDTALTDLAIEVGDSGLLGLMTGLKQAGADAAKGMADAIRGAREWFKTLAEGRNLTTGDEFLVQGANWLTGGMAFPNATPRARAARANAPDPQAAPSDLFTPMGDEITRTLAAAAAARDLAAGKGGGKAKGGAGEDPAKKTADAATAALKREIAAITEAEDHRRALLQLSLDYPDAAQAELEARLDLAEAMAKIDEAKAKGIVTSEKEVAALKAAAQAHFAAGQAVRDQEKAVAAAEAAIARNIELTREQEAATREAEARVREAQAAFDDWVYLFEDLTAGGEDASRALLALAREVIPELLLRFTDLKNAQTGGGSSGGMGLADLLTNIGFALFGGPMPTPQGIGAIDQVGQINPASITTPLPKFASGTPWFRGGAALVGEDGPEIVDLPMGARVTPNDRLGGTTELNLTVINQTSTPVDARMERGANGDFRLVLREAMRSAVKNGDLDSVNRARYGLRPVTG